MEHARFRPVLGNGRRAADRPPAKGSRALIGAARLAFAIYLLLLLVATHWPHLPLSGWSAGIDDKTLHAAAYAGMALLAVPARPFGFRGRKALAFAGGMVLLLGVGTECTQLLVPGRGFEWLDALASVGGGAAAIGALDVLDALRRRLAPGRPPHRPFEKHGA